MSAGPLWGVRLAEAWVRAYTATAPPDVAVDRRAEVAADVADELRAAGGEVPAGALSRRIAGRALRGVPADLAWRVAVEVAPGRGAWHLSHPATAIGALTAVLVPLVLLSELLRLPAAGEARGVLDLVHAAVVLLSAAVVALAVTAAARRLVGGRGSSVVPRRGVLRLVRRWAGLLACVSWAAAALWRFVPGTGGSLAALAWAVFGVALLLWLLAVTATLVTVAVSGRRSGRDRVP